MDLRARAPLRLLLSPATALALALGIFALRALDTARLYNHTWDEPLHVAAGLELLQYGAYRLEPLHPPLARAPVIAAGVLLLLGIYLVARRRFGDAAAASAGSINIGHRHVLAIEPLLALMLAGGVRLASREGTALRRAALPAFLLAAGASTGASLSAHPDALGYTNLLAGRDPDRYLADSNIDWGQDLGRLARWVDERGLGEEIHLAYFGNARPERHGLRARPLAPNQVVPGWIAASATTLRGVYAPEAERKGYEWLLGEPEAARIGTSIRVYKVTAEEALRPRRERPRPLRPSRRSRAPGAMPHRATRTCRRRSTTRGAAPT